MAANVNSKTAISDVGTLLFVRDPETDKYKYLLPITTSPATGAAPSMIDVTEMDSPINQSILGRSETPAFEFDYNYTAEKFSIAKTVFDSVTEHDFVIAFNDKSGFTFSGIGATWTDGYSANNAIPGKIAVAVSKCVWSENVSALIDASSIPKDRFNPFTIEPTKMKYML